MKPDLKQLMKLDLSQIVIIEIVGAMIVVMGWLLEVIEVITSPAGTYIFLAGILVIIAGLTLGGYAQGEGAGCCFSGAIAFPIVLMTYFSIVSRTGNSSSDAVKITLVAGVLYLCFSIIFGIFKLSKIKPTPPKSSRSVHSVSHIDSEDRLLVRRIPPECYKCGASIDPEHVDWIGPDTVRCEHCGASLVVGFERI